jgi:hypothetical protein
MVTMQANNLEQALTPQKLIFGLTVQNIPTMNLRFQYRMIERWSLAKALLKASMRGSSGSGM